MTAAMLFACVSWFIRLGLEIFARNLVEMVIHDFIQTFNPEFYDNFHRFRRSGPRPGSRRWSYDDLETLLIVHEVPYGCPVRPERIELVERTSRHASSAIQDVLCEMI